MVATADTDYHRFLEAKRHTPGGTGFEPVWLPDSLFDFQRHLVEWACRRGRAATFAGCGLGKTAMQLVLAENVVRRTNRPALVLTPLAVAKQTVAEGEKFGVECVRSADGTVPNGARVVVTNYQRLHHFDPHDYALVVCDESSILKDCDGATRAAVTEFVRTVEYRQLYTATAAPNDWTELGTSSEALGELGFQDMVSRFFHKQTSKDAAGWGRTTYRMRAYAERDFWRWVCSWGRAVRRPSDLGFSDARYALPDLVTREHVVAASAKRPGRLFDVPADTIQEQQAERRRTIPERCGKAAELVSAHDEPAVVWCHLNAEGDLLQRLIPGSEQVSGATPDERKEELFDGFGRGQFRVLISKPSVAGFGLNWQHCAHQTYFPSHSFESYFQAVRRCWRFGQTRPVVVEVVTSEGEAGVLANLTRKAEQAERMFDRLAEFMADGLRVDRGTPFRVKGGVPAWMSSTRN